MSAEKILKRSGPRIDPCGTTSGISDQLRFDYHLFFFVIFCLISSHELAVMQVDQIHMH